MVSDLEMVSTRIERLEKETKKASKRQALDKAELEVMLKMQDALEQEKPISTVIKTPQEMEIVGTSWN